MNDHTPALELAYGKNADYDSTQQECMPAGAKYEVFHEPEFYKVSDTPRVDTYTVSKNEKLINCTESAGSSKSNLNNSPKSSNSAPVTRAALKKQQDPIIDNNCRKKQKLVHKANTDNGLGRSGNTNVVPPKDEFLCTTKLESVRSLARKFGVHAKHYHKFLLLFQQFNKGGVLETKPYKSKKPTVFVAGTDVPIPTNNKAFKSIEEESDVDANIAAHVDASMDKLQYCWSNVHSKQTTSTNFQMNNAFETDNIFNVCNLRLTYVCIFHWANMEIILGPTATRPQYNANGISLQLPA